MFLANKWKFLIGIPVLVSVYLALKVERSVRRIKKLNPGAVVLRTWIPLVMPLSRLKFPVQLFTNCHFEWLEEVSQFNRIYNKSKVLFMIFPEGDMMIVRDTEMLGEVFTKKGEFIKPVETYHILNVFGPNIVSTNGPEWKRHRKVTGPHFGERSNELVFAATRKILSQMMEAWNEEGDQGAKDISAAMYEVALTVISSVAFGMDLPWIEKKGSDDKRQFKKITFNMVESWLSYAIIPSFIKALPIKSVKKLKNDLDLFEDTLKDLIDENKKKDVSERQNNMLGSLVESIALEKTENTLTLQEVIGDLFIFMFAGHETTAGTLSFTFSYLALEPAIQQRLYEEIAEVCGDRDFQYSDLQAMPYALAVFYETLRLKPPVSLFTKKAKEDTTLGKYSVPKDCVIGCHVMAVQHSEDYWGGDYLLFRPNRWFLDPECAASAKSTNEHAKVQVLKSFLHSNRYAFLPFSEGQRACLGKRFAEVEAVTVLVTIIQKYQVFLPEGANEDALMEADSKLTYKQKNNAKLTFKKRISQ